MAQAWNEAAGLRCSQIESGLDITFSEVFVPYYLRMVDRTSPRSLLEVGCGTGHLARAIAPRVSKLVAIEPSDDMSRTAEEVLRDSGVIFRRIRVEDMQADEAFDLVIAHLVVQMVETPTPFSQAVTRVLASTGRFVCALPHPCFWNNYREYIPRDRYKYMRREFVEATLTVTKDPSRPITNVPYYHRPIQDYVKAFAASGLHVVDMDEIYPDAVIQAKYGREWEEPRYVVLTCRRGK